MKVERLQDMSKSTKQEETITTLEKQLTLKEKEIKLHLDKQDSMQFKMNGQICQLKMELGARKEEVSLSYFQVRKRDKEMQAREAQIRD